MTTVQYRVWWQNASGQWVDLPWCNEPDVAAYLVKALLKATQQVGDVVKVERFVQIGPE